MNEFAVALYVIFAMAGATLLLHVLYLAINDLHLNRTDHPSVIKARKRAFFGDAIFLALTVGFREYWLVHPTVISVAIVSVGYIIGGMSILIVNVVSLRMRAPPPSDGHGYQIDPARSGWWRNYRRT